MTFHRAIVERCGVPIVRKDAERRVVFGEIMLPAPKMEEGQHVKESELSGLIHYDGGYMVAEEISRLVDRFAIRRPIIDVEHDGEPRAATLVESTIVREASQLWTLGAWVGGVKVHQDDTWEGVEDDELRAFSVAFMVKVRSHHVIVEMDVSGGEDRRVQLHEFLDPHPHALSLVKNPATGAMWKMKVRSLPQLPVVDREWDAEAAYERVRSWAGDDVERLAQAFVGTQVADVADGRLVVVRSRVDAARTWLADAGQLVDDGEREAAVSSLDMHRDVLRGVVDFQDLPLADEDRQWDGDGAKARMKDLAGGDDWDPAKYRRGFLIYDAENEDKLGAYSFPIADVIDGQLRAVPKGIFAAAAYLDRGDVSEDDRDAMRSHLGKYYEKMDRTPPWEEESEEDRQMGAFADHLDEGAATLVDGTKALFAAIAAAMQDTEGNDAPEDAAKAALSDFTQWSHGQVDELGADGFYSDGQAAEDAGDEDADENGEEETEEMSADDTGEAGEEEDRADEDAGGDSGGGASSFTSKMKIGAFQDKAWQAAFAMLDTLREIVADEDVSDKPGAMRKVLSEYSDWMDALIGELDAEAMARALEESPDDVGEIFRAGRKIATKRLKRLESLAAELLDLIQDLKPAENEEESERSEEPPAEQSASEKTERGGEPPAEETEVDRSAGDNEDAQASAPPDTQAGTQDGAQQALMELLESVRDTQGKLVERMEAMESGRPASGTAGGLPVGTTGKDKRAPLREFFFSSKEPESQQ